MKRLNAILNEYEALEDDDMPSAKKSIINKNNNSINNNNNSINNSSIINNTWQHKTHYDDVSSSRSTQINSCIQASSSGVYHLLQLEATR